MPEPLAICIEDLGARNQGERYLRCVAMPGREPGLRMDRAGTVLWKSDEDTACLLCVSLDDRLILLRPEGAAGVIVRREGRSVDVPAGKPVVLLDQDQFETAGRRLRVHVHGTAPAVVAPSYLPVPEGRGVGRAAAAAVALGAALGAAGCAKKEAEVPKDVPQPPVDAGVQSAVPDTAAASSGLDGGPTIDTTPPIEVRVTPPAVRPPLGSLDEGTPEAAPDAATEAEPEPAEAPDAAKAEDGRRVRDVPRIEIRTRPPIAMPRDDESTFEK